MIYLLLSILFSTITVSFFKLFERYGVDTLQGIVFNYLTCAIAGSIIMGSNPIAQQVWQNPWFIYTVMLGVLFITIFFAIAQTAQRISVSASMVAAKLSVVIPVLVAVFLYNSPINTLNIAGILISFVAVWLISQKQRTNRQASKNLLWLPLAVFLGSGCIDSLLNYIQKKFIPPATEAKLVTTVFSNAFLFGIIFLLVQVVIGNTKLRLKNILWGFALGIPNYFSMYFLVKTLTLFEPTRIFPINNIGIVAASTIAGVIFFTEKPTLLNKIGLLLAIFSIVLISRV
jgi:drug/metabolite transporter (DMT)-like permease